MNRQCLGLCALAAISLPGSQLAQAVTDCKSYYSLAALDPKIVQLLGTSVVPASPALPVSPTYQQLRNWDFPSKVSSWKDRPSADEIAKRRDELMSPAQHDNKSKKNSAPLWVWRPYGLQTLPSRDWNDLEKWFDKEAPKKLSGACVDPGKATYVLAVGIILDGSADHSLENSAQRNDYKQSAAARQQDAAVGVNAGTFSPGVHQADTQELSGMGGNESSPPGAYTCAYFYRTDGKPVSQGGILPAAPDYYYCKAGGTMPRSAIGAMLKFLAGVNLP